MNRRIFGHIFLVTLAIAVTTILPGCKTNTKLNGPSTLIETQPGDIVTVSEGLLAPWGLDELTEASEAILIGKVVEILASQRASDVNGNPIIYTDVVIQPSRYLHGGKIGQNIAVRVIGGRIGNEVLIADWSPVFHLDEDVLVFLVHPTPDYITPIPPPGINIQDYYGVVGAIMGKWQVEGDRASDFSNKKVNITELEKKIAAIQSTSDK